MVDYLQGAAQLSGLNPCERLINRQCQEYGSLKHATKQFQALHVVKDGNGCVSTERTC